MYRGKYQARKPRGRLLKGLSLLLSLLVLLTSVHLGGIATLAEEGETVTVTVNYVYESNHAMVAQPYTAQISKGAAFKKTLEIPKLFNYSIPADKAQGLVDGIILSEDATTKEYTLTFDLASVDNDVTVTLFYKAGTAKYTVYHYYQNLGDDKYNDAQPKVVEFEGDIDAYTQAVAENTPGYHCKGVPQTTIAADGTTVVEIYYDRDYYTVTFDVNGGVNGPEPKYAKYGTTFEANTIKEPSRKGYTFLGWQPILADTVTIERNVTYVAQWQPEKGQADYTIVIWGQNANDDEYSYLSSNEAWGNVGNQVTWNEGTLISHVHTEECRKLTCGQEEHTHSDERLICGKTEHTHSVECCSQEEHPHTKDCYGSDVGDSAYSGGTGKPSNPKQGQVYEGYLNTYIYIGSTWYYYTGSTPSGSIAPVTCGKSEHTHGDGNCNTKKCGLEEHSHTDACYGCGKTEHTHGSSCGTLICSKSDTPKEYMRDIKPSSALWVFDHSDTVTVDANGSTVLNVYFKRTEFTLTFQYGRDNSQTETITERWGADVKSRFDAIEVNAREYNSKLSGWGDSTTGYYTNNVMVMPQTDKTFTAHYENSSTKNIMTYYAADLDGAYKEIFRIIFYGDNYTVTADEYYEWEGFKINNAESAKIGSSCKNANFYYDRNTYKLEFYSASNSSADKDYNVKYQDSLSQYNYMPTNKPDTVEQDAVFVGWYLNPECTGEAYDLSAHVMPSNNIALYAKWVNGLYTVRTYTDDTMQTLYTYEGYNGVQENIEKYTLAMEPTSPVKDGYVFVGWFYKENGAEKPFSFTMPITKDYDLYPKFSEPVAVSYTVHYYKAGTTEKVADDRTNSVMIGTTVTEKAKMGTELNLLPADKQNKYYPTNTSTSVIINQIDQEIIFYYTEATSVSYTVYYQDANGNNLINPVTKTTEYSTVTEQYVPIANYAPRQYSITQDMSSDAAQNKIVFIYDPTLTTLTIQKSGWEEIDENQTFLFRVKGTDENTEDIDLTVTVHGNGKTTITDLPVGRYTVSELTGWSWRYTPDEAKEIDLTADGLVLEIANSRTDEQWLNGDNFKVNLFGKEG